MTVYQQLVRSVQLGLGILVVSSCTSLDSPTAPPDATAPAPQLAVSASADPKAAHEKLKRLQDETKEAFKARKKAERERYKAARDQWKLFKKQYKQLKKNGLWVPTELLSCEPQEFDGDAEIIGPNGGSIHFGAHKLIVPKGALDAEVLITAEAPLSETVEVELQPHGLRFSRPVELELSYDHCVQPPNWVSLFVVYIGDNDEVLEVTPTINKKGIKEVVGRLEHFSRYAVAW